MERGRNEPLEVPELVAPLRDDAQGILEERYNNEEPANCWQVRFQRLCVDVNVVLNGVGKGSELFDWFVGVGCPVTRGRAGVGEAVGVGLVASRGWPSDMYA